jgi:GDPmannose 4,6-dehydratase
LGAQTFVADSWNMPMLHFQTNAISTLHILESIRKYCPQCKLYLSGSSEEVGDVDYSPQDEKHPLKPRSPYAASKATGRLLAKVYRESYNIFVVQGILFNHESERRQDYFVTRKITKGVARIYHAIKNNEPFTPIELGNLDARRDWSHAEDFIDGVWKMLNQESPKDYVLSSNETHTIKEFVNLAFVYADIPCAWHGEGEHKELSIQSNILSLGEAQSSVLVKVNPKFYRPAEVELLLGNSDLARRELGWKPKISFDKLVEKMVKFDIDNYPKSV